MLFFILLSPAYRIGTNVIVDAKYKKGVKNDPFKLLEIVLKITVNNKPVGVWNAYYFCKIF